jgi:hypothetical protein
MFNSKDMSKLTFSDYMTGVHGPAEQHFKKYGPNHSYSGMTTWTQYFAFCRSSKASAFQKQRYTAKRNAWLAKIVEQKYLPQYAWADKAHIIPKKQPRILNA